MDYNENSKISMFNAGVAQAERIDSLQRAINAARFNPQDFNVETKTFHYQIIISSLNGLMMEAWSKLDNKEQIFLSKLDKLINDFIKVNPVINQNYGIKTGMEFSWNSDNYRKLLYLLSLYEKTIKEYL